MEWVGYLYEEIQEANSPPHLGGDMKPRKPVKGFIYKDHPMRNHSIVVYPSLQELRWMCGEVEGKDIEEVVVVFK